MYTSQPKKLIIISILNVLKKYTDENHRLSQKEIGEILKRDYDTKVDRKAIKRNLMDLVEFGYDIEYTEVPRINKNGEEETIYTDWYFNHSFEESELRLLIDSLLFSKHIPYNQCKELIKKLTELSSDYFRSHVKHVVNLPENLPRNKEILYTIEILDEAISKKKQVSFNYTFYGLDKEKHLSTDKDGVTRDFIMNPYQMVATNGRYYLIGNLDKYDDTSNYRVDRISNIQLMDTSVKPLKKVKGAENGLDLPKHMAEHIYMYSDENIRVKFLANKSIINDLIDWFGMDVDIKEKNENQIEVTTKVNKTAMKCWALQFIPHGVEVLSPKSLRDEIRRLLKESIEKYK